MVDHADWCSVSFYLDGYTVTRWEYVFVLSYALIDLTILFDTMCIRLSIDNVYATYDDAAEAFDSTDEILNRVVVEEEDQRSKRANERAKMGPCGDTMILKTKTTSRVGLGATGRRLSKLHDVHAASAQTGIVFATNRGKEKRDSTRPLPA